MLGSIIGYDNLFNIQQNKGIEGLRNELQNYATEEEVKELILYADAYLGMNPYETKELEDLTKDQCYAKMMSIVRKMIKNKYGNPSHISLQKVLLDYADMGLMTSRIYGEVVDALNELEIIIGQERMHNYCECGDILGLKKFMEQHMPAKDVEDVFNAMEENLNMAYRYTAQNGISPEHGSWFSHIVRKGNNEEFDEKRYNDNAKLYKRGLLSLCKCMGNIGLAEILKDSWLNKLDGVNREDLVFDITSTTQGQVEIKVYLFATNSCQTLIFSSKQLLGMTPGELKKFATGNNGYMSPISPADVSAVTNGVRSEGLNDIQRTIFEQLDNGAREKI